MNVLHIIPGDLWAGAEAQVYYLIRELCQFPQLKVTVLLFNRGQLHTKLKETGIDVELADEMTMGGLSLCNFIRTQIIDRNVHIAHVHEYKSHILTALARLTSWKNSCVLFRTLHGQNLPSNFKSRIVLGLQNFFLQYLTDHLITVSAELTNQYTNKFKKAKVHCFYNAVDPDFLASNSELTNVRKSFALQSNQYWIGTAARLEEVKNHKMLIDAARILKNKHPELNFRVSIFGEGSLRDTLRTLIELNDLSEQVTLEGHNKNILPILQSVDVFTLTSIHEGLPMSLLEAMSAGTVPICTAVGGMKEIIIHGKNGFLVNTGDSDGLADIFANIAITPQNLNQIRDEAIKTIENNFSVGRYCKKLVQLYETALSD